MFFASSMYLFVFIWFFPCFLCRFLYFFLGFLFFCFFFVFYVFFVFFVFSKIYFYLNKKNKKNKKMVVPPPNCISMEMVEEFKCNNSSEIYSAVLDVLLDWMTVNPLNPETQCRMDLCYNDLCNTGQAAIT